MRILTNCLASSPSTCDSTKYTHYLVNICMKLYSLNIDNFPFPCTDLLSGVTQCYSDVPEANLIEHTFDVKSWLLPHLLKLHSHSYPHLFRFTRGSLGQ